MPILTIATLQCITPRSTLISWKTNQTNLLLESVTLTKMKKKKSFHLVGTSKCNLINFLKITLRHATSLMRLFSVSLLTSGLKLLKINTISIKKESFKLLPNRSPDFVEMLLKTFILVVRFLMIRVHNSASAITRKMEHNLVAAVSNVIKKIPMTLVFQEE